MALQLSHYWRKEPNWFYSLDTAEQIKLLAHYRIQNWTPKERDKRKKKDQDDRLDAIIKRGTK